MSGMKSIPLNATADTLRQLSPKYAALAAIGITTGGRISELLQLKRGDLLDEYGRIRERITFVKLKARKTDTRQLILPRSVHGIVKTHLRNEARMGFEQATDYVFRGQNRQPLKRQAVYNTFKSVLGEGHGTHWMRKTFAQELYKYFLLENPNDSLRALDLTRQALGHTKIDTTVRYLGLQYTQIDNAQKNIFKRERLQK